MNTFRPIVKPAFSFARRTIRALVADLLAVFTLGMLVGFLWWSQ